MDFLELDLPLTPGLEEEEEGANVRGTGGTTTWSEDLLRETFRTGTLSGLSSSKRGGLRFVMASEDLARFNFRMGG